MKMIKFYKTKQIFLIVSIFTIGMIIHACSGNVNKKSNINSKSIDTLSEQINAMSYVGLGAFDSVLYEKGKSIFVQKCTHCHALDRVIKGPALRGVTKRHTAKWVENLLASLQKLAQADSIVKHVFDTNHDVYNDKNPKPLYMPLTTEEERRALIEFLRKEG